MTLTPEAQKNREHFESIGIYATWLPDGSVNLTPTDIGVLAVWTNGQVRSMIEEVRGMFIVDRARIQELEDDVHDLKRMVYMGESPGV